MNLLKNGGPKEVNDEIDKFTGENAFDDNEFNETFQEALAQPGLKEFLRNCSQCGEKSKNKLESFINGALKLNCMKSRICRDQVITLIACSRSFLSFGGVYKHFDENDIYRWISEEKTTVFSCKKDGDSWANSNRINWYFSQIPSMYGFKFETIPKVTQYNSDPLFVVSHEIGHVILGELISETDTVKTMSIASQAIKAKLSSDIMEQNLERLRRFRKNKILEKFPLGLAFSKDQQIDLKLLKKNEINRVVEAAVRNRRTFISCIFY